MADPVKQPKYKCPECGWIGEEDEMEADYEQHEDFTEESWSNYICPSCKRWFHDLEDYEEVN